MTNKKNIDDVTDSPEDWEDFWFNEDLGLSYSMSKEELEEEEIFVEVSPYVEAILGLTKYPAEYKRESPLSE